MDLNIEPIKFTSRVGYDYLLSLLAVRKRTVILPGTYPFHCIDPDILVSEELWRYLSLPDWIRVRQTCRAFLHHVESETVFKVLSSLSGPCFVTGEPTWKQRLFLQHYVSRRLRSRRQPSELRVKPDAGWISHKFPPFGYALELHQHTYWPSNVPGSLLAGLNLIPSRCVHDESEEMRESSKRRRGRLLYFYTDLPVFWDSSRFVCQDRGCYYAMALRCTYHVAHGAVAMVTEVIKQPHQPTEPVPLDDFEKWLPCSTDDQDNVRERIVTVGYRARGVGLCE